MKKDDITQGEFWKAMEKFSILEQSKCLPIPKTKGPWEYKKFPGRNLEIGSFAPPEKPARWSQFDEEEK